MFAVALTVIDERTHKYVVTRNGEQLAYADVLHLWQQDDAFRAYFISLLADSPFTAYRWETPPITSDAAARHFEFVLLDSPGLARTPDTATYSDHFANADGDGIVVFANLGNDAVLVVPAPTTSQSHFDQLATFMRSAPEAQKHAFWRTVGRTVQCNLSDRPLWLSTAGGGVAWLHVRLDSRPKYYRHAPYRNSA